MSAVCILLSSWTYFVVGMCDISDTPRARSDHHEHSLWWTHIGHCRFRRRGIGERVDWTLIEVLVFFERVKAVSSRPDYVDNYVKIDFTLKIDFTFELQSKNSNTKVLRRQSRSNYENVA